MLQKNSTSISPKNHQAKEEDKAKEEKSLYQSASMSVLRKKNTSISPKNNQIHERNHHNGLNQKNGRSLSINTESNSMEPENFLKTEDLMLKILEPLNCNSISKGKQFTELKGVFSSLIIISPTKNMSKIIEPFARSPTKSKKKL